MRVWISALNKELRELFVRFCASPVLTAQKKRSICIRRTDGRLETTGREREGREGKGQKGGEGQLHGVPPSKIKYIPTLIKPGFGCSLDAVAGEKNDKRKLDDKSALPVGVCVHFMIRPYVTSESKIRVIIRKNISWTSEVWTVIDHLFIGWRAIVYTTSFFCESDASTR